MVKVSIPSKAHEQKIAKILSGDVKSYVQWADHKIEALGRNREFLVEQRAAVEARCNAAEARLEKVVKSEAEQRSRAQNAEASLVQLQARLAKAAVARQASSSSLEKAIRKLARNPKVVKKLVLVCHPDKCPSEVTDSASELFRYLQSIREKDAGEGKP